MLWAWRRMPAVLHCNEAKGAARHLAGANVADLRRKGHPRGESLRGAELWLPNVVTFARLQPMRQAAGLQGGQM